MVTTSNCCQMQWLRPFCLFLEYNIKFKGVSHMILWLQRSDVLESCCLTFPQPLQLDNHDTTTQWANWELTGLYHTNIKLLKCACVRVQVQLLEPLSHLLSLFNAHFNILSPLFYYCYHAIFGHFRLMQRQSELCSKSSVIHRVLKVTWSIKMSED